MTVEYRIVSKLIDLYHVTLYTLSEPFWFQEKAFPIEYAYMVDSVFFFVFVGFAIWY